MVEELSLIRFSVMNFWAVLINSRPFQPVTTLLIKIVEALISTEETPDEKDKEKLKWIYEHTHEKIEENLSIVELAVFKNLDGKLSREIEIGDKTFYLTELYKYLDEVTKELSKIVIKIAKKYSIDLPINLGMTGQGTQKISFENEPKT